MFKKKYKVAKSEFTISQLPKNRKEVFFDCLKVRYDLFLKIGLVLFIFGLPIIIILFYHYFLHLNVYQQFIEGSIDENTYYNLVIAYRNIKNLLLIAGLTVFSIGIAGAIRVIRLLIWYEGISFTYDFYLGIKQNIKHVSLLFLLGGLINFINGLSINETIKQPLFIIVENLPLIISIVFLLPIGLLVLSQITIYADKFIKYLRNGFTLYLLTFIKTIIVIIGLFSPLLLLFFNILIVKIIAVLFLFIIYLPIGLVIWQLYSCSIFDKYINQKNYPHLVNKGILNKEGERNEDRN